MILQLLTTLLNLGFGLLVGASAALAWLGHCHSPHAGAARASLPRLMLVALSLMIAISFAIIWVEAAELAEVPLSEAWPAVQAMAETHHGRAALGGIGTLGLLVATVLAGVSRRGARVAVYGLLALFAYSRAFGGHAGASGSSLDVVVDALHLLLVSLWLGAVFISAYAVLPRIGHAGDAAAYAGLLSSAATVALAGLVATGVFNAWRALGEPAMLLASPYGTALLVKLAFVGGAAILGGYNRFVEMPRLEAAEPGAQRRFVRVLRIESVVLAAALAAAAVLSTTPPPGE